MVAAPSQARDDVVKWKRRSRDYTLQANGVEVPIMERDRPRWRFRISTLMLLVVILGLVLTLVVDRWKRLQNEQQLAASLQQALGQAEQVRALAVQAQERADRAEEQ